MSSLREDMLTIIQMYWPNRGWISRAKIAQALDRQYGMLSSDDIRMLRQLAQDGLIEAKQRKYIQNKITFINRWEYRAK